MVSKYLRKSQIYLLTILVLLLFISSLSVIVSSYYEYYLIVKENLNYPKIYKILKFHTITAPDFKLYLKYKNFYILPFYIYISKSNLQNLNNISISLLKSKIYNLNNLNITILNKDLQEIKYSFKEINKEYIINVSIPINDFKCIKDRCYFLGYIILGHFNLQKGNYKVYININNYYSYIEYNSLMYLSYKDIQLFLNLYLNDFQVILYPKYGIVQYKSPYIITNKKIN